MYVLRFSNSAAKVLKKWKKSNHSVFNYVCKSCGYKWDADSPNQGSDPNNTSDSSDDGVVICDVPPRMGYLPWKLQLVSMGSLSICIRSAMVMEG